MKTFSLLSRFLLMLVTVVLLTGCQEEATKPNETPRMFVRLENQTEHSGIMVKILELNRWTTTDSQGYFQFDTLQNGNYTFQARYPYFKTEEFSIMVNNGEIQPLINLHLKQLLQFWIEPAETTVSQNNFNNPNFFAFSGMRMKLTNISSDPVKVRINHDPLYPWGLVPQELNWPCVPNPDNRPDFCYEHYGWLGNTDAIILFYLTIYPGDTLSRIVPGPSNVIGKDCVRIGKYLFFSLLNNDHYYPEYFDAAYFWIDTLPHPQPYNQLNKTLIKKQELFRPAIINITN